MQNRLVQPLITLTPLTPPPRSHFKMSTLPCRATSPSRVAPLTPRKSPPPVDTSPHREVPLPWGGVPCRPHITHHHHAGPSQLGHQPCWQGTNHASHLPLDQGLTWHPTHDTHALIISDAPPPIPAATSDIMPKTFTSTSVYTPSVSQVKDASNVIPAPNKSCFKDALSLLC